MREGYARVSKLDGTSAAGKIRKIRCACTDPICLPLFNTKGRQVKSYFNFGETSNKGGLCPRCNSYEWFRV